jgi:hypothetical protein
MSDSAEGSSFLGLKILGRSIPADVAPNTTIALPGIGSVTLRKTERRGNFSRFGTLTVEMISVSILETNNLGLAVGARIVVGRAVAGFDRHEVSVAVGGRAYATSANADIGEDLQNRIGKAAAIGMGCEGTRGHTRTRNIAGLAIPGVLTLAVGETTAFGGPTAAGAVARTTAEVKDVQLLGGLVRLGAVRAVAHQEVVSGIRTSSAEGTRVLGLRIAGLPLGDVTRQNIRLTVPLVGSLFVNEVVAPAPGSRRGLRVNGVRLVVELLGGFLPIGSEIILAHASSMAR